MFSWNTEFPVKGNFSERKFFIQNRKKTINFENEFCWQKKVQYVSHLKIIVVIIWPKEGTILMIIVKKGKCDFLPK